MGKIKNALDTIQQVLKPSLKQKNTAEPSCTAPSPPLAARPSAPEEIATNSANLTATSHASAEKAAAAAAAEFQPDRRLSPVPLSAPVCGGGIVPQMPNQSPWDIKPSADTGFAWIDKWGEEERQRWTGQDYTDRVSAALRALHLHVSVMSHVHLTVTQPCKHACACHMTLFYLVCCTPHPQSCSCPVLCAVCKMWIHAYSGCAWP